MDIAGGVIACLCVHSPLSCISMLYDGSAMVKGDILSGSHMSFPRPIDPVALIIATVSNPVGLISPFFEFAATVVQYIYDIWLTPTWGALVDGVYI